MNGHLDRQLPMVKRLAASRGTGLGAATTEARFFGGHDLSRSLTDKA
jgi:hypothetical protein